jgi:hypothetical protein
MHEKALALHEKALALHEKALPLHLQAFALHSKSDITTCSKRARTRHNKPIYILVSILKKTSKRKIKQFSSGITSNYQ